MRSDARLYGGLFDGSGERASLGLAPGRLGYVHLVRGCLNVNGQTLQAGDALLVQQESELHFSEGIDAEIMVFDLAPR
jgi:redox-sensitive bicupin YhaK (pirin superfamily)